MHCGSCCLSFTRRQPSQTPRDPPTPAFRKRLQRFIPSRIRRTAVHVSVSGPREVGPRGPISASASDALLDQGVQLDYFQTQRDTAQGNVAAGAAAARTTYSGSHKLTAAAISGAAATVQEVTPGESVDNCRAQGRRESTLAAGRVDMAKPRRVLLGESGAVDMPLSRRATRATRGQSMLATDGPWLTRAATAATPVPLGGVGGAAHSSLRGSDAVPLKSALKAPEMRARRSLQSRTACRVASGSSIVSPQSQSQYPPQLQIEPSKQYTLFPSVKFPNSSPLLRDFNHLPTGVRDQRKVKTFFGELPHASPPQDQPRPRNQYSLSSSASSASSLRVARAGRVRYSAVSGGGGMGKRPRPGGRAVTVRSERGGSGRRVVYPAARYAAPGVPVRRVVSDHSIVK